MKNLSLVLLGAFITFAATNIQMCSNPGKSGFVVTGPGYCDNRERWMADIPAKSWEITEDQKNNYSFLFRSAYPVGKGSVFISKRIFDTMFSDLTANGIVFYFGLDTMKRPLLVLEADRGDSTQVLPSAVSGTGIYYQRTYCPPNCDDSDDTSQNPGGARPLPYFPEDTSQVRRQL